MHHDKQLVTKDEKTGRVRVRTINNEPTMAQQQFKDECDINVLMKRHMDGENVGQYIREGGIYADFTQITDLREMIHTVQYAQDAFMTLPASVRKRFDNDPTKLLEFVQNKDNFDEAVSLGIATPRQAKNDGNQIRETKNAKNEAIENASGSQNKSKQKNDSAASGGE